MTQYPQLLMLLLCIPFVMAGARIHPWHPDRQASDVSEVRTEAGKRDKPVVTAAMPMAFGLQSEVLEFHDISNTKDKMRGGTQEPNQSTVANLGAQAASRRPLGVLSTTGGVSINNSPAPSQATIFAGDTVRTDNRGLANFTLSGQGSIGINPNTEVSFVDDPNHVAVLHSGTLTFHFLAGATTKFRLRVLNYSVAAQQDTEATAEIIQTSETAATVNCLSGSVAVTDLQSGEVNVLQAGQSFETEKVEAVASAPQPAAKSHRTTWIVVGLAAGGGAAGAAAALASRHKTVSPSSP